MESRSIHPFKNISDFFLIGLTLHNLDNFSILDISSPITRIERNSFLSMRKPHCPLLETQLPSYFYTLREECNNLILNIEGGV